MSGQRREKWESTHRRQILLGDLAVVSLSVWIAYLLRFGESGPPTTLGRWNVGYLSFGIGLVLMWLVALTLVRSRDSRVVGSGPDEYRRVGKATVLLFGWFAIFSVLFKFDSSRGYLAVVLPLGLTALLLERWVLRLRLRKRRRAGFDICRVVVVGGTRSAESMARRFESDIVSGYRAVGVWVPDRHSLADEFIQAGASRIPVFGNERDLIEIINSEHADTVAVTDTEHLGPDGMSELAWELEGLEVDLLVAPNVIDVAGPRMHMRALSNMPFIHLDEPQYVGASRLGKVLFDRGLSAAFIVVMLPLFVGVAIAVKLTSSGPVLYRQERIGRDGATFDVLKFRTMKVGAEAELAKLMAAQGTGATPLFKVEDDPRVTYIGRFLRKYSLDELPQLFNVLRGDMSLVGPRPQVADEVQLYDHKARRRLKVKPGMTGLWQVSGRSSLSWDETVKLDLSYVENWSIAADTVILMRTLRAVVASEGAR
ncbi:sugar transferase [soil metagenome]